MHRSRRTQVLVIKRVALPSSNQSKAFIIFPRLEFYKHINIGSSSNEESRPRMILVPLLLLSSFVNMSVKCLCYAFLSFLSLSPFLSLSKLSFLLIGIKQPLQPHLTQPVLYQFLSSLRFASHVCHISLSQTYVSCQSISLYQTRVFAPFSICPFHY